MEEVDTRVLEISISGTKSSKKKQKMLEKSSTGSLGCGSRAFESRYSDQGRSFLIENCGLVIFKSLFFVYSISLFESFLLRRNLLLHFFDHHCQFFFASFGVSHEVNPYISIGHAQKSTLDKPIGYPRCHLYATL